MSKFRLNQIAVGILSFAVSAASVAAQSTPSQMLTPDVRINAFFRDGIPFSIEYLRRSQQAQFRVADKYFDGKGTITMSEIASQANGLATYIKPMRSYVIDTAPCVITLRSRTPEAELKKQWDGKMEPNQETAEELTFDLRDIAKNELKRGNEASRIKIETLSVSREFHVTDAVQVVRLPVTATKKVQRDGEYRDEQAQIISLDMVVDASRYSSADVVGIIKSVISSCPTTETTSAEQDRALSGVQQALGSKVGQCWNIPAVNGSASNLPKPVIRFRLSPSGEVIGTPVIVNGSQQPQFKAVAESAVRAVKKCSPYTVPADFTRLYPGGEDIEVSFSADL